MNHVKSIILALCLVVLVTVGCSKSSESVSSSIGYAGSEGSVDSNVSSEQAQEPAMSKAMDLEMETANSSGDMFLTVQDTAMDRKIIRDLYMEQKVNNLKNVIAEVQRTLARYSGAYIENMSEWKNQIEKRTEYRAQLILRVPIEQMGEFMVYVEQLGIVISRSQSGQDVTEEFVDNEARVRNLKTHEERILALYQKAEKIEEMLQIEAELSRIRGMIEEYEGRQKYLTQVTSTARFTLELFEVEPDDLLNAKDDTSVWTQAWIALKKSFVQLGVLTEQAFIYFVASIPYLILLMIIAVIVYILYRRRKK
jgi:hypothetical protein